MATREGQARRDKVVELPGGFWLWMRKALDLEKHSTSTQLVPRQKWPPTRVLYGWGDLLEGTFLHVPKICKNQRNYPKQKANQLARTLPGTPRHVVLAFGRFCECCEQCSILSR